MSNSILDELVIPLLDDTLRKTTWLKLETKETGKYGTITNALWLELEKDRFEKDGNEYEVVFRNDEGAIYKILK